MSMTPEQMHELVADVLADEVERITERVRAEIERTRSEMFERLHDMERRARAPDFQLTPTGELYCNGAKVGDVRPVFQRVVQDVLKPHVKKGGGDDDA